MTETDSMGDFLVAFTGELEHCQRLGLIGVGQFGSRLQNLARERGVETLLCDPPRSLDESEEIGESFFQLWGNGMGGCEMTRDGLDSFLPLATLASRCDVMSVQVPVVETGPWPTVGMLDRNFLSACRPDLRLYCACDPRVFSPEVLSDHRLVLP